MKRKPMPRRKKPMGRHRGGFGFDSITHPLEQARRKKAAELVARTELAPLKVIAPKRVISMRLQFNPQPKREYVRSPYLLTACRLLVCQHCFNSQCVGVCAAHSNWSVHGKGKSIKADDNRVAALGFTCHSELDQGKRWSEAEKQEIWWTAHVLTVRELQRRGLWPADVPVPDTANCPFWASTESA